MAKNKQSKIIPQNRIHGRIQAPSLIDRAKDEIKLSFKYFDPDSADCLARDCESFTDKHYWKTLLDRLRALNGMTRDKFCARCEPEWRNHKITWSETSRPNGFTSLNAQIRDQAEDAWQFQLTKNAHGRVHGFFLGSIFFVVWLDPDHGLYPGK